MPSATGANTTLYGHYEQSFDGSTEGDAFPWGSNTTLDTLEGSHQAVRVFEPNDREAKDIIEQLFDGSFTLTFDVTNGWFLRAVISDIDTDSPSGSDPYTYDFNGDSAAEQYPNPFKLIRGVDRDNSNYSDDKERTLGGCVVATADISVDVNGNLTVSLTGAYASDSKDVPDESNLTTQPATGVRTLTFANGTITTDSGGAGTDVSRVQNATITINNNVDMVGEIGERKPVDFSPKARNPEFTYTKLAQGDTELQRFYGGGSNTTADNAIDNDYEIEVQFASPLASEDSTITITIGGNIPDGYNESGIGDPNADFENELSEMATTVSASYESGDDLAASPFP